MFWKLLISLILTATAGMIVGRLSQTPEAVLFAMVPIALLMGYHREVLPTSGRRRWFAMTEPTDATVVVRFSMFGVPLGRPRTVKRGARGVTTALELLPWYLSRAAGRASRPKRAGR